MSDVSRTKPVYSGIVTRKPSTAPTMARIRANGAFLSSPVANTRIPKMIGNQIATLITGNSKNMLLFLHFNSSPHLHCPDNHALAKCADCHGGRPGWPYANQFLTVSSTNTPMIIENA